MSAADLTEEKLKTVIRTWEVMGSCHLNPRDVLELLQQRDELAEALRALLQSIELDADESPLRESRLARARAALKKAGVE